MRSAARFLDVNFTPFVLMGATARISMSDLEDRLKDLENRQRLNDLDVYMLVEMMMSPMPGQVDLDQRVRRLERPDNNRNSGNVLE